MSANDPLRTFATLHNVARMVRSVVLIGFGAMISIASSASATPPPPPAPHNWTKIGWECPGQKRSFIEIEQLGQGSSGYQTKVVGLVISGRKVDPATVAGLKELVERRNYLRPVGGYCDGNAEMIGIEELASGPKKAEAGWRSLRIPYAPRP